MLHETLIDWLESCGLLTFVLNFSKIVQMKKQSHLIIFGWTVPLIFFVKTAVFCCCCFVLRIVWLFEQRWFKIEILCKIINVFTVTFDYFNASLLNKSINFFPKKNKKLNNPKYAIWVVSISWNLQHQCQSCSLSDPVEPRWLISFSYSTFIFSFIIL